MKAPTVAAVVIVDLEAPVASADGPSARAALIAASLTPARTVGRVNPMGTADHDLDLNAISQTLFTRLELAKAGRAEHHSCPRMR